MLRPTETKTTTVAVITISGETVSVSFPEIHDGFNGLVKELGYRWERPLWVRRTNAQTGSARDRAAELGHRLLLAGFCVEFGDETLAPLAMTGDYAPEHTRWVLRRTSGNYQDWFFIRWARQEDFYREARALRGSRYDRPGVVVPAESYDEVLDFAESKDFRLSDGALALSTEARARWEQAVIATPAPAKKAKRQPAEAVAGIAPELMDDPL